VKYSYRGDVVLVFENGQVSGKGHELLTAYAIDERGIMVPLDRHRDVVIKASLIGTE